MKNEGTEVIETPVCRERVSTSSEKGDPAPLTRRRAVRMMDEGAPWSFYMHIWTCKYLYSCIC